MRARRPRRKIGEGIAPVRGRTIREHGEPATVAWDAPAKLGAFEGDSMATNPPGGSGGRKTPTSGTAGRNRNAYCSFCRKSYRDVGPLVEGPGRRLHLRRVHRAVPVDHRPGKTPPRRLASPPSPTSPRRARIKEKLDQYVIGQQPRQEGPLRRRAQPLQAAQPRRRAATATSRSIRATSCSSARPAAARRSWPGRSPASSTCPSPSATPPR